MYPNPHHAQMPPPQARSVAPETFLLDQDAQQSLPPDSVVALQQVDNRTCTPLQRMHPPLTPCSQILSHLGAR
jgi:hypothetical protein